MSAVTNLPGKVVPAQLGFFAIYNPSLGTTDETFEDQIVYYSSKESRERNRSRKQVPADPDALRDELNEQLRQIGLAQGMVEFGRSFSDGSSVDTVETERSRIILHELEAGWWILASIDLTVIPATSKTSSSKDPVAEDVKPEYSSRELKPAFLLLGDILRAHSTFLLHHASSLSALFVRTRRSKFVVILGRYWDTFLSTWTVLMHGNPARNLYGGIKLAASGELGIGVGEEERGSAEREVLEGFVGRIDGLVDVIVSKFGDAPPSNNGGSKSTKQSGPWLGSGEEPAAEDGAVFLGIGALSRKSIRDVSHWIEDLYRWGPYAYGVMDNPSSNRRRRKPREAAQTLTSASPGLVSGTAITSPSRDRGLSTEDNLSGTDQQTSSHVDNDTISKSNGVRKRPSFRRGPSHTSTESETSKTSSKLVQYLKLGYGSHWSLGQIGNPANKARSLSPKQAVSQKTRASEEVEGHKAKHQTQKDSDGHFLIGLLGNVEELKPVQYHDSPSQLGGDGNEDSDTDNDRVLLRTLTVELEREQDARAEAEISIDLGATNEGRSAIPTSSERTATSNTSFESQDRNKTKKLRVVVYVKRPFVFVMLYELRTEGLAIASLYKSLHQQLSPLVKPLLTSTTFQPLKPEIASSEDTTPIYDLIWDPKALTVTSNIPNIPDPYHVHYDTSSTLPWSRIDALNTHMQIIHTYISTIASNSELERTSKTSRGWWIVWTCIPDPDFRSTPPSLTPDAAKRVPGVITDDGTDSRSGLRPDRRTPPGSSTAGTSMVSGPAHPFLEAVRREAVPQNKEIFLIRRARDHVANKSRGRFGGNVASSDAESWTAGPGRLVQGIGVDTKWYIDSLLNLNR